MPRNFLEGCEAVPVLLEEASISPDQLDTMLTQAHITIESDATELVPIQEQANIDSLAAIEAAEAADECKTCQDLGQCTLGQFLKKL